MPGKIFKSRTPDSYLTEANLITLIRLVLSITFYTMAVIEQNPTYNLIGFGIHLIGDFIDGACAKLFKQETILGAEIDLIADRIEVIYFYVNLLHFNSELYLPVLIYLMDYAFVDFYLGYQFNKYDIISPDYFFKVDKTVHLLNFSKVGKFVNSTLFAVLVIFLPGMIAISTLLACCLVGVKSYSVYILLQKRKKASSKYANQTVEINRNE
ncbi:CDP-alcohol phosphatidyltransferase family protein [candidate division KSB1 bacterium]